MEGPLEGGLRKGFSSYHLSALFCCLVLVHPVPVLSCRDVVNSS